jgi:hypothetical protein
MLKAEANRGLCTAAEATKKEAEAKRLLQQELVHMATQVTAQREEIEARNFAE